MKKMIIAVATLAAAILVLGLFRVIRQENSPKETERKNEETERKNEETDSKNEEAKETVPTHEGALAFSVRYGEDLYGCGYRPPAQYKRF